METKIKRWLFGIFALILFLPLIEHKLQFIKSGELGGIFTDAPDTTFTLHGWWKGTYQPAKEQYLNDHTGFRPDLVRLNSQIDFSFFDVCHAGWIVLGKDYDLFQSPYINAYYGVDFCHYKPIQERAVKLKAIQDTLEHLGKTFVLVYAASKVSSYPEHMPPFRARPKRDSTNHDVYRHVCDSLGVNQIDVDEWFMSMKGKSKEPLFSRQGIHWTIYGAILVADSLINYIERVGHIPLQHPVWSRVERTDKLRGGDDDLAIQLNLFTPYPKDTLGYPVVEDPKDTTRKKLNGIYLGDSFCQKMLYSDVIPRMSGQCEFWSYFNSAHDIKSNAFSMMTDYDWKAAIRRADCLVIEYTTFNFPKLGDGFIEQAYDYYYPNGSKYIKK